MQTQRPVEILLIEDNPGDIFLTKKAFESARLANNISVAQDGEVALDILLQRENPKDTPTPDIILLDLNIPKIDGKEVLEVLKNNNDLKRIPVVILSSSNAEKDIVSSYDLHANSYIVKPINLEKFSDVVTSIENFWFSLMVLPSKVSE